MLKPETFRYLIDRYKAEKHIRTDTEICKAIGVSKSSFSQYARDPTRLNIATMARICTYLGMSREDRGMMLE